MVGPKKQDFWPRMNILEGEKNQKNPSIKTVCQKLGMILEINYFQN
jgi:hypothetical protein